MYDTALEASVDDTLNGRWTRAGALVARLLAEAGPGALEGDGRAAFVARILPLLRPVAADTVTVARSATLRQLTGLGVGAATPSLAALALSERDVHNLLSAAARYYFAAANTKDYTNATTRAEAFRYATQLTDRSVRTALSARRLDAATRTYDAAGIRWFERYLGSGDACDRCKEVAGARVSRQKVKPLHDGCNCGVRPVTV